MSFISAIFAPFSAETGRIVAMRAAWKNIPSWKRWLIGSSVLFAGLAGIGLLLTSFVFTGGATAAILGGIVAGLSIGAGVTGAIANAHTAKQCFEQGKYLRGIFALIGCASGLLGSLGAIFHLANAVNTTSQLGIGVGASSGTVLSTGGAVVTGCMERSDANQSVDGIDNYRSPSQSSDLENPLLSDQENSTIEDSALAIVKGLNSVPVAKSSHFSSRLDEKPQQQSKTGIKIPDSQLTEEKSDQRYQSFGM